MGIERILLDENPSIILVEGDTNTVLAGALAAHKLGVKVGHVEAGLRSYDRRMPEEVNRVLADHCSDYLFAPTENSRRILLGEGIPDEKIFVTGNTIVDAVHQNLKMAEKSKVLEELKLCEGRYFLATLHRQENVDDKEVFSSIMEGLEEVNNTFNEPVVYPVHPRARKMMDGFKLNPGIMLLDSVDYLSFLRLEKDARLILTDSGGVQEEACILKVPCVTLRENTERPETVDVGANVIAGTKPEKKLEATRRMVSKERAWENPFGEGNSGDIIVDLIIGAAL